MSILALELSGARGSVACVDAEGIRFSTSFANDRKHSGLFFENVQRCLREAGQPGRIVVGLGPGSYAGTRIAIATAVGLRAATSAELAGLPSLCAIETAATEYRVIGDARRQRYHFARVHERACLEGPRLYTGEELAERLRESGGPVYTSEALAEFPAAELAFPSAVVLAQIAMARSEGCVREPLEPIYLSAPYITPPRSSTAPISVP